MSNKALLIVDVQNDFLPGGALEVKYSDEIIDKVNYLINKFDNVIATQDWHPANHKSFASNNKGKIGEIINLNGIQQILWPDHCVENTRGSEFSPQLNAPAIQKVIRKGSNPEVDSYSGFFENDKKSATELDSYLKKNEIDTLYICGLATDYCVKFTALDAVSLGYNTILVKDATRAVNMEANDGTDAISEMQAMGVKILNTVEI